MDNYPGRKASSRNPLRLNKKVWLINECKTFIAAQTPSDHYTLNNIALNLHKYQSKTLKLSYSECNKMVVDHFKLNRKTDKDTMDTDDMFATSDEDDIVDQSKDWS